MSVRTIETIAGHVIHPLCALFPQMGDDELDALAEDIKANGQQQPILTYDGQVVDGRNRLIACGRAGVAPLLRPWEPRGGESLVAAIAGLNLHRRHLTASQRAMLAAELVPFFAAEAKRRQQETQAQPGETPAEQHARVSANLRSPVDAGKAAEKAASVTGASERATEQARRVTQASPKLAAEVKAGAVSLGAAEKKVREKRAAPTTLEQQGAAVWRKLRSALRGVETHLHDNGLMDREEIHPARIETAMRAAATLGVEKEFPAYAVTLARVAEALACVAKTAKALGDEFGTIVKPAKAPKAKKVRPQKAKPSGLKFPKPAPGKIRRKAK